MSAKLFQFAAILHPKTKAAEKGEKSQVIVEVQTVLAPDQNTAVLLAARQIPEDFVDQLEDVEVVVRPF